MKHIKINKVISAVALSAMLVGSTSVYAQTLPQNATPSASNATSSAEIEQTEIEDLKEKIATKVAELRKKNQKAYAGTITGISGDTITIVNSDDVEYEVKVDPDLTTAYIIGTTNRDLNIDDLEDGDYIIVTGPILDRTIDANYIYQDETYTVLSGKITEIDADDFSIKVLTTDKDTYTLDIENSTDQTLMNIKTFVLEKIGFSKLKEGDTIHFVIKKTGEEQENRFSANKVVIVPQEYFQQ